MDVAGAARVAALYDIHGNLPALEAVLDPPSEAAMLELLEPAGSA